MHLPMAVRAELQTALGALEPNDDRRGFYAGGPSYVWYLDATAVPEPRLLRLLCDIAGLRNLGPAEKLAWEYTFTYRGVRGSLADQKIGMRLYLHSEGVRRNEAGRLRTDVLRILRDGLDTLSRRFLTGFATTQLRAGSITLANQAHRHREMVNYFRTGAAASFAGHGRLARPADGSWRIFAEETEGYFNAVAMVSAYFAWLEHVLVLALPFRRGRPDPVVNLKALIRSPWGDKFDTVLGTSRRAELVKMRLASEAASFRNRHLHGGFELRSWSVAFHIPDYGAVSMAYDEPTETPMLAWRPLNEQAFQSLCRRLDATDAFLRRHPRSRNGLRWAESGLDVSFDLASRAGYAHACASDDALVALIEEKSRLWERAVNMEW